MIRFMQALCSSMLLLCLAAVARADLPLDVSNDLSGVSLGARVDLLEDPSGKLTLADVRAPSLSARFVASEKRQLGFGFTDSAQWLRLRVLNSSSAPRSWLWEVGFPHLDDVVLHVPDGQGGYVAHQTGDMVPFARRDLSYRNFVFMLAEPAHGERVYYLRVKSRGVMNVPITAWSLEQFAGHQHLDWAGMCVFYGIILMMAGYNLALYGFTREAEHLRFALFVLSMGVFQLTIVGHTFEFLLPNQNALAQTAVPFSIMLALAFTAMLGRYQLDAVASAVRERKLMAFLQRAALLGLLVTVLAPFRFSIRFAPLFAGAATLVSFVVLARVLLREGQKARLYVWGWSALLVGTVISLLTITGILPGNFVMQWAAQIGASIMFVLVSAAMASKVEWLRGELRQANAQLAQQVHALEHAVTRAELSTSRAERALRVKDEFMATMSHELRTPLNTIINVPQGLVEDFPLRKYARCESCKAHFELEVDELISAESRCPECHAAGRLELFERAAYIGEPARTTRYLETIERSGKHLLQVVNGILRTERVDHADAELSYSIVEIGRLARDVVDEMREWAGRSGVALELSGLSEQLELALDPLRIRQVLLNLIGNAIKFSDGRGTVTLCLRRDERDCFVSVCDQGIGIAQDKLAAVFDSYQQAHDSDSRQFGGTGLGLSISRALVQKHGGELWVESVLGKGATFTFRISRAGLERKSA